MPPHDAVAVWIAPLSATPARLAELVKVLSADERQRAARFTHVRSREQFIIARSTLRRILGRYLGHHPADLCFVVGANGKPSLVGGELFFNVSHSGGLAVYAVTQRSEVGIDVEQVRQKVSYLDMAQRFFAPEEAAAVHALPPERSEEAFFHVWTRKEAFIKAIGLGLAFGLDRFEVSVPPDDPPRVRSIDGDATAAAQWSMQTLTPAPGYIAALAIQGPTPRIELHDATEV